MTDDALCDLLAPGVVAIEQALGLPHCGTLAIDDDGLHLTIQRQGREQTYLLAHRVALDSGLYSTLFLPKLREAFNEFLAREGVRGVKAYLEQRGPRELPMPEGETA